MIIREALRNTSLIEDADLILAHVLGKPKEFLFMEPGYKLSHDDTKTFKKLLARRQKGEPYAYLVGHQYFRGLKFIVTPDVLIPRPETEWLTEQALKNVRSGDKVLDMGTGSGCVAISLAKESPKAVNITAADVSVPALEVARRNAKVHKTKVKFMQTDLFTHIKGKFDIIIANLPYVPRRTYEARIDNLRFEPVLALTDQTNTWKLYRKFLENARSFLKAGGRVYVETDPASFEVFAPLLDQLPNTVWKHHYDLNNLKRYIEYRVK
jgi:release factor glutamine methyltransferase